MDLYAESVGMGSEEARARRGDQTHPLMPPVQNSKTEMLLQICRGNRNQRFEPNSEGIRADSEKCCMSHIQLASIDAPKWWTE